MISHEGSIPFTRSTFFSPCFCVCGTVKHPQDDREPPVTWKIPVSLSAQKHWIKIVYANHHSKVMLCAVTIDNADSQTLTEAVNELPWPKKEEFYMVKQFSVVK